jgi:hypothetical protein
VVDTVLGLGRLGGLRLLSLRTQEELAVVGVSLVIPSLLPFSDRFALALVFLRILVSSASSPLDSVVETDGLFLVLVLTSCYSILGFALLVLDVIGTFVIMALGGAEMS